MSPGADEAWFDDTGPLVRPYALTRGRARPARNDLDMISMVGAARPAGAVAELSFEHERVVELCQRPLSIAELAAQLEVPLVVAKVLVSDLLQNNDIVVRGPGESVRTPDTTTLQAVLDGIRRL